MRKQSMAWSLACACLVGCTGPSLNMQVDAEAVRVSSGDQPFATFHYLSKPRPHVWPLFAPGQIPVTRNYPMGERDGEQHDHPHHQSLWFAHGNVDGFDFWHGKQHRERIELDSIYAQVGVTDHALVQCEYVWRVDEDRELLRETRQLKFHDHGDVRMVDVLCVLRAVGEQVTFGDTKEGTFALRMRPELRADKGALLTNSEGDVGKPVWGKRARWIDDTGVVDGSKVGVAIFDHPDNLRHPTWWHARAYGLLAANPFGIHDFERKAKGAGNYVLRQGETLKLRYRVLLHRGLQATEIDARWSEWATAATGGTDPRP